MPVRGAPARGAKASGAKASGATVDDPPVAALPPPPILARGAAAAALAALPEARAVGGAVRDTLAGREIHDVDIAVPLPPDQVADRLRAAGLGVHATGLAHGTLTATLHGNAVEVTSLRRDVVTDGRHAVVEWTTDWLEDAARRDFTINAMSMTADGRLWDYFDGTRDLAASRVRFVGDPRARLAEDYLRALRFFRFQARYGGAVPDADAVAAITDAVPGLARLSVERIWMEIKRLLEAPDPTAAVALMATTGVLAAVLPEGAVPARLAALHGVGLPRETLLRLAVLVPLGVDARSIGARLRWSAGEVERFQGLRMLDGAPRPGHAARDFPFRAWRVAVRERSRLVQPAEPLWIAEAEFGGGGWDRLRAIAAAAPAPEFPLQGRDAVALGVPPGPEVGRLIEAVRAFWLSRDCSVDEAALRRLLVELAAPT
jgi:poly(A) polymerase